MGIEHSQWSVMNRKNVEDVKKLCVEHLMRGSTINTSFPYKAVVNLFNSAMNEIDRLQTIVGSKEKEIKNLKDDLEKLNK